MLENPALLKGDSRTPLSDQRLATPMNQLLALAQLAESWNDPNVTAETSHSAARPASRPPGRTQCDWAVRQVAQILQSAVAQAQDKLKSATIHEQEPEPVETVGGIVVAADKRNVRVEVVQGRLLAKYGDKFDATCSAPRHAPQGP